MNALLFPAALTTVNQYNVYLYLQLVAVFTLLILLVERELAYNVQHRLAWMVRRVMLIGIIPLLFAFLLILAWHISYAT